MTSGNSVPMAAFGPGALFVMRNDVANQTPFNIGYAQSFEYSEAAESKDLYGQNQYPLVIARGTIKSTGKIKAATISGLAWSACFYGQNFSAGAMRASLGEAHSVPATGPYTVTPVPPSSGVFDSDLGLSYALSGLPLLKVASAPAVGQYSISGGTYTFSSADASASVMMNYAYSVAGTGQKIIVQNTPIGSTPSFQIDYVTSLNGQSLYLRFYSCVSTKLSRAFKITDFMIPEIDFGFFPNAAGNVMGMWQDVAA